jgi:hypothetical protein
MIEQPHDMKKDLDDFGLGGFQPLGLDLAQDIATGSFGTHVACPSGELRIDAVSYGVDGR